jgi:predicted permease
MRFWKQLFRQKPNGEDLDDEVRSHLRMAEQDRVERGESPEQARSAARREFGNVPLVRDGMRESWGWMRTEHFVQDLRYAVRRLGRSPAFTLTVLLSLALGLGANATIFTFANALLFRSPAVADAGRLVEVMYRQHTKNGSEIMNHLSLDYPGYALLRDHNHVFSGFAAFDADPHITSWNHSGQGEVVHGQMVSGNFFSVLGVNPALGRTFRPEEDQPKAEKPVMVVSYAFWKNRLDRDPSAPGRVLVLNGTSYTIVGVAPVNFTGVMIGIEPDFWLPLAMMPTLTHAPALLENQDSYWLFSAGWLKPGVSQSQAQAELSVLARSIRHPHSTMELSGAEAFPLQLVPAPFRGYVAAFTGLLMAATGLVLLIACANAANLLLARAITRRRELAVRSALGASRFRLARQTLSESMLLSLAGGVGGLAIAARAVPLLMRLTPASLPISIEAPLDWRVVGFTLLLSLLTGILFGLTPALRSARRDLVPALKDETRIAGTRRSWLRDTMIVLQVTVCLVLLIGAGLCVRSLLNARSIDPGFDTHGVVLARLDPGSLGYSEAQGRAFYAQLLERVRALPGVASASLANYLPLGTEIGMTGYSVDGFQPPAGEKEFSIQTFSAAPGYFAAMSIPLLNGRDFSEADTHAGAKSVVINEAMAKRFWPGASPIGQHIRMGTQPLEIVGVVKTGKYRSLSEEPQLVVYKPLDYSSTAFLVVRDRTGSQETLGEVRRVMRQLDPNVVPMEMESISQYMALSLFAAHTTGVLLAVFGLAALLLAAIGLYGVISYSVSQQTGEIGVRMALGADRGTVLRLVLGQGMRLTLIGLLCGLGISFAAMRVLTSLLYGIRPDDPVTYLAVSLFLATVALSACWFPARRAASIEPMQALRFE